jgi:hypothetical protein
MIVLIQEADMSFDIDEAVDGMVNAVSGVLTGKWSGLEPCVKRAFQEQKAVFDRIGKMRVDNLIDDRDVDEQLGLEKAALEAALLACRVESKVAAQNAVNAAIGVLTGAIKAAAKVV